MQRYVIRRYSVNARSMHMEPYQLMLVLCHWCVAYADIFTAHRV
jgi:hypothetical protein